MPFEPDAEVADPAAPGDAAGYVVDGSSTAETQRADEMHDQTDQARVDATRELLEAEQAQLRRQLQELGAENQGMEFDDNFADSGQVAAEQGEARTLASRLREQLSDVERALTKLDEGTYGLCEVCGERISDARLEAMPTARYCIHHAG
ncbi:MAG: TraR/DksA family transcriptional regulator [Acidimicrobiales bacterium]|nr:TraR/DksA family transcriptional regulator [Acidimicrobiales bacterium]